MNNTVKLIKILHKISKIISAYYIASKYINKKLDSQEKLTKSSIIVKNFNILLITDK